jgi:hypothetical protein
MATIGKFLETKKITEYRQLTLILNQDVFEKHYKFTIAIDQLPSLEINGSQNMVLRCFKHHLSVPSKPNQGQRKD